MIFNKNKNDDFLLGEEESEHQLENTESLEVVRKILINLRTNIDRAIKILSDNHPGDQTLVLDKLEEIKNGFFDEKIANGDEQVVEGVFNGSVMVGADGKEYQVPPNYASKSKLVEGDILKLTIDSRGNFIYKQIGPIERKRLKGKLSKEKTSGQYLATVGTKKWKLLTAAVTYFKGDIGDEVVILVPKESKSLWAAVENIVKN